MILRGESEVPWDNPTPLSITNPTWTGLESKFVLRSEKPETDTMRLVRPSGFAVIQDNSINMNI